MEQILLICIFFLFMHNIFNVTDQSTILVSSSIIDTLSTEINNKRIIIANGSGSPDDIGNNESDQPDKIFFEDGSIFELRSIGILQGLDFYAGNPSKFDTVRYIMHGGHYSNWWKQERSDKVVTRCTHNVLLELQDSGDNVDVYYLRHLISMYWCM